MGEINNSPKEDKGLLDFINSVKKVSNERQHKISNSLGVYDAYKYYRKNKPKDKKYILTESQYFYIIRQVNTQLGKLLSEQGEDILLPNRMGRLELRKYKNIISFKDGKLYNNLPIDWNKTLKLWYYDKESKDNKTLVKVENKETYRLIYNKSKANYNNKGFYKFRFNRDLKKKLKKSIKDGKIDAFMLY